MRLTNLKWFAALLLALAAPAWSDTYTRQPGIKITNYTFDITLSDGNDEFVVQDTVAVQFLTPGIAAVELDLCNFGARAANGQRVPGSMRGAGRRPQW